MENASNALIIAGEVLIGVLIISLFAYIVVQFGTFSEQMHEDMADSSIKSFNNNFTMYINRNDIKPQEVVSVIKFAKNSNDAKDIDWEDASSDYYVRVYIDNKNVFHDTKYINNATDYKDSNKADAVFRSILKDSIINTKTFYCKELDVKINENTRQVNEICFHTN